MGRVAGDRGALSGYENHESRGSQAASSSQRGSRGRAVDEVVRSEKCLRSDRELSSRPVSVRSSRIAMDAGLQDSFRLRGDAGRRRYGGDQRGCPEVRTGSRIFGYSRSLRRHDGSGGENSLSQRSGIDELVYQISDPGIQATGRNRTRVRFEKSRKSSRRSRSRSGITASLQKPKARDFRWQNRRQG